MNIHELFWGKPYPVFADAKESYVEIAVEVMKAVRQKYNAPRSAPKMQKRVVLGYIRHSRVGEPIDEEAIVTMVMMITGDCYYPDPNDPFY